MPLTTNRSGGGRGGLSRVGGGVRIGAVPAARKRRPPEPRNGAVGQRPAGGDLRGRGGRSRGKATDVRAGSMIAALAPVARAHHLIRRSQGARRMPRWSAPAQLVRRAPRASVGARGCGAVGRLCRRRGSRAHRPGSGVRGLSPAPAAPSAGAATAPPLTPPPTRLRQSCPPPTLSVVRGLPVPGGGRAAAGATPLC